MSRTDPSSPGAAVAVLGDAVGPMGRGARKALAGVELAGSAAFLAPAVERLADAVDAAAAVDVRLMMDAVTAYVAMVDRLGLDPGSLPKPAPEPTARERAVAAAEGGPR